MANVRTLSVALKANTAGFEQGMKRASRSLSMFQKSSMIASRALSMAGGVVGGIGLSAALRSSIAAFADFEKSMGKVGVLLDGKASKSLAKMSNQVEALSEEFGLPVSELSAGLFDIVSAGIDADKAIGVLRETTKGALLGFSSVATVADAVTTILNSYGMSADRAGEAAAKLFTIQKLGKTDMERVAASIGNVASTAALAGLSLDELGAAISTITVKGVPTEETMTAINALVMAFLKPQDNATEAAKKFGIELSSTTMKTEGLISVLEKLKTATAEEITMISGTKKAVKGLAALTQGLATFEEHLAANVASTTLDAKKLADVMNLQATGWNKAKEAMSGFLRELGEEVGPGMLKTVNTISKLLGFETAPQKRTGIDLLRQYKTAAPGAEKTILGRQLTPFIQDKRRWFGNERLPVDPEILTERDVARTARFAGAQHATPMSREGAMSSLVSEGELPADILSQILEELRKQNTDPALN